MRFSAGYISVSFGEVNRLQNSQNGRRRRNGSDSAENRKKGKYTGYLRLVAWTLVLAAVIISADAIRRQASHPEGNGGLSVFVDRTGEKEPSGTDETSEPESVPAEAMPYEKKEINEDDFRPVVKTRADLSLGELVMVNRANSYNFPNISAHMVKIASEMDGKSYKVSYNTLQLQKEATDAFNRMMADFYDVFGSGDVTVVTAAVTYQEQNESYRPPAADAVLLENESQMAPGFSEHHTGYAVDLKLVSSEGKISAYDGTGNYKWINDNCYKYGFILRYPNSKEAVTGVAGTPSHLRYVGVPHSYIIRENGFALEEYMTDLKKYIHGYEHLYYSVFGYDYEIYFVPADEAETVVPVPKNEDYSVSGNNCDGFIVTITRKSEELKNEELMNQAAQNQEPAQTGEDGQPLITEVTQEGVQVTDMPAGVTAAESQASPAVPAAEQTVTDTGER